MCLGVCVLRERSRGTHRGRPARYGHGWAGWGAEPRGPEHPEPITGFTASTRLWLLNTHTSSRGTHLTWPAMDPHDAHIQTHTHTHIVDVRQTVVCLTILINALIHTHNKKNLRRCAPCMCLCVCVLGVDLLLECSSSGASQGGSIASWRFLEASPSYSIFARSHTHIHSEMIWAQPVWLVTFGL